MRKKMKAILCILAVMAVMSACSGKQDLGKTAPALEYNEEEITNALDVMINFCDNAGLTQKKEMVESTDFELEYQFMTVGLSVTPEGFRKVLASWDSGTKECGAYKSHGDYIFEEDGETLKVTAPAEYEKRNADLVFSFDNEMYLESMTVNAEYSTAEILQKAGLNTLLGMGTVFAVLILISFIISLFRFIPAIQNVFISRSDVSTGSPEAKGEGRDQDDTEIIAVITAALAAEAEAEGVSADGYVVRRIKRRPANKW